MIRLFKDLKIKYYITELIGIVILLTTNFLIYGKTGNDNIYSLIVLLTLVYIILVAHIYTKKALKRILNLSSKVNSNTDLEETINSYEHLLTRAKNKKMKTHIIINLSRLYINTNQSNKALALYKNFNPAFDKNCTGICSKIIYLENMCEALINEKEYTLAKENLSIIKRLLETDKINSELKTYLNTLYNDLLVKLVLKEGKIKDYEKIEKYYVERFNEEEGNNKKVFISHELIKVYKKLKNKKEETKYKKFYNANRNELKYN